MTASAAIRRANASRIMRNTKLKERDRQIALWNFVLTSELAAGTQFLRTIPDSGLYAVLGDTHEVVALPRRGGDHWHAYFHTTYGFGERELVAKFIYDTLRSYAFIHGERVELRRFAAFNQETLTTYISAYNGYLYKVAGASEITIEPQGTDGVFFADDDGGLPVTPDIGPHGILLPWLTGPNFIADRTTITPAQQQMALTIWMFAVAFPDLLPTKPILLLEGEKGAGKTSVVMLLHLVLFGNDRPINLRKDKEDDFGIILLRNPVALLDNQDSFIDWLPNALCAYATGAVWEKRKLFTDDGNVIIKPRAFISFTTRNPASFRRDDVVDRCVILRFARRTTFTDELVLKGEILADRARLLGEYLWYLGRIVDELHASAGTASQTEIHRMAAFAAFGRIVGRVLDWAPTAVDDLMRALQAERDAFMIEEDPLINVITEWLEHVYQAPAAARLRRSSNRGRLITAFDLASELEFIADGKGLPWKESARTLTQKLRMSHIEVAFRIEQHTIGGNKAFRIWRKSDPTLEVAAGVADP